MPRSAIFLLLPLCLSLLSSCSTTPHRQTPVATNPAEFTGVVTGVAPLVVQPDLVRWHQLKPGMTEADVARLLGPPFRKNPRPEPSTRPGERRLYAWWYGEITFSSFTTRGSFDYTVVFHDGVVCEIHDPWNGHFSPDGKPTAPELIVPVSGQAFHHYPRFLDFRWQPSSGQYPIEYEVVVEILEVSQEESEHYEAYIRRSVERNRAEWTADGMTRKAMDELAIGLTRELRSTQGVQRTLRFLTHDLYLPLTWVGANTGRWRVRAVNERGTSEWTAWRYFSFSV